MLLKKWKWFWHFRKSSIYGKLIIPIFSSCNSNNFYKNFFLYFYSDIQINLNKIHFIYLLIFIYLSIILLTIMIIIKWYNKMNSLIYLLF